jgi:hypothetical protein
MFTLCMTKLSVMTLHSRIFYFTGAATITKFLEISDFKRDKGTKRLKEIIKCCKK